MMDLGDHLFRRESGRMVAALTRIFGVHNLELAEDVVQDAFCRALEVWSFHGVPENPAAWLMTTAKNRALDIVRRERSVRTFAPELERLLHSEWTLVPTVNELLDPTAIQDDQLRMMFSCCHPRLPETVQVAIVLRILCGFGVNEIAHAFLVTESAIEKRIQRGKKVLAGSKRLFDLTEADDFAGRLEAVQRTIYLVFNEGYHGSSADRSVRADLCKEAMYLCAMLREHPLASAASTYALSALMCLHAARLSAHVDESGNLTSTFDQERARWDRGLVAEGLRLLDLSAAGTELTAYHIEAAIAAMHAIAQRPDETDWEAVVSLYDTLMTIGPSPVVALNRGIAVGHRDGARRGLDEIRAIVGRDRLTSYPFYSGALGEFELRDGRPAAASEHFRSAIAVARNPMEQRFFERRLQACEGQWGDDAPNTPVLVKPTTEDQ